MPRSPTHSVGRRHSTRAFTLVELLVVIGIIAILASIIFPVFLQTKRRALLTKCTSNVRQIGIAVKMYVQDYDERFPYARTIDSGEELKDIPTLRQVLEPYVRNEDLWFCPSWIGEHGDLLTAQRSLWRSYDATYGYNAFPGQADQTLLGRRLGEVARPDTKPMVWCASGSAHSGINADEWAAGAVGAVNVCYVDGHVKLFRGSLLEFTNQVYSTK